MDLNVYILGDLDFATNVMHGVARLFMGPNEDSFHQATAVVMIIMMFIASLKYFLDPEKNPYPFREFVFSLIAWVIFVGPLSPRFDITLESFHNPLEARTVDNIPFLAAVPAWVTSNLFGGIRDLMQDAFTPVGFVPGDGLDPLGALVTLHNAVMPEGAGNVGEDNFDKTMQSYLQRCYIAENKLDPEGAEVPIDITVRESMANLIDNIRVSNNSNLTAQNFLDGQKAGPSIDCPTLYTKLRSHHDTAVTPNMISYFQQLGVTDTSLATMQRLLTGNAGAIDTPYDLMANRLILHHLGSAAKESGLNDPWVDKMMTEATTNRSYGAAAERSMFLQYMLPMVSMFEMFAFYIAPIMMLLVVMGGLGWGMLGKYMYLILFVNLWGFIKVFVDLYTYLAAEKAFEFSAFNSSNFLSPADLSSTVIEVESFLGVAAGMTAAIPMLAMFLLYGGVHSLMGVMRQMNPSGAGNVDSKNLAPSVGSNWDKGSYQAGKEGYTVNPANSQIERNFQQSNDPMHGQRSYTLNSQHTQAGIQSATDSTVASTVDSFGQQAQRLINNATASSTSEQGITSSGRQTQTLAQQTRQLAEKLDESDKVSTNQAYAMAAAFMFETAAKAGLEFGGTGAGMKLSDSDKESLSAQTGISWDQVAGEAATLSNQWSTSESSTSGNQFNLSDQWSSSAIDTDSFAETFQSIEQMQNSFTLQDQANQQLSQTAGVNSSYTIDAVGYASHATGLGGGLADSLWERLGNDNALDRFKELSGASTASEFASNAMEKYGGRDMSPGQMIYHHADDILQDALKYNGDTLGKESADILVASSIAGGLYSAVADTGAPARDVIGYEQLSSDLRQMYSDINSEGAISKLAGSEMKGSEANGARLAVQQQEHSLDGVKNDASNHRPDDNRSIENADRHKSFGQSSFEDAFGMSTEAFDKQLTSPLSDAEQARLEDIKSGDIGSANQLAPGFSMDAGVSNLDFARTLASNSDDFGGVIFGGSALARLDSDFDGVTPFESSNAYDLSSDFRSAFVDGNSHSMSKIGEMQAFSNFMNSASGTAYLSGLNSEDRSAVAENLNTFERLSNYYQGADGVAGDRFDAMSQINALRQSGEITNESAEVAYRSLGSTGLDLMNSQGAVAYEMQHTGLKDALNGFVSNSDIDAYLKGGSEGIHRGSALATIINESLMSSAYSNAATRDSNNQIATIDDIRYESSTFHGSVADGLEEFTNAYDKAYKTNYGPNAGGDLSHRVAAAGSDYIGAQGLLDQNEKELAKVLATSPAAVDSAIERFANVTGETEYADYASIAFDSASSEISASWGVNSHIQTVPEIYANDFSDGSGPMSMEMSDGSSLSRVGQLGDGDNPYAQVYKSDVGDDYFRVNQSGVMKPLYSNPNELDDFRK